MIIWSGLGFLVLFIIFANSLLANTINKAITGNDNSYQENTIPITISLLFSSIVIYFLGKWLNTRKAKTYIDKETGKEIIQKGDHSFFFIRMEYWGIIIPIIMIILLIKEQFK